MAPNPGRIRMYTSGWPKNQNKCWNRTGSPPPLGSKNDVFKFRSVNNIVIAPASTGKEKRSKIIVKKIAQINNGVRSSFIPFDRILIMVEIKLIDPMIEEIPAKWSEKIAKSTDNPLWAVLLASGGYTVHPVPTPLPVRLDRMSNSNDGSRSQNLKLLSRGKAISGAPIMRGNNQFPNPPIKTGITKKNY